MKKSILIKGPILTRSGYGEQTRFLLRALKSREDLFDLYIQPLSWGQTSWLFESDNERQWIDNCVEKTIAHLHHNDNNALFDASVQVTIPNEWSKIAPINIGYTAGIESTRIAGEWIIKSNEMDRIIVISNHSKYGFSESKYNAHNNVTNQSVVLETTTPIDVVNYPAKKFEQTEDLPLNLEYDFNFLTIAQMGPRKNLLNTIKWFIEEFRDDEVGLVVKSNIAKNSLNDRRAQFNTLKQLISSLGDHKCKVYLLHGDMTDKEMHALYVHPKVKSFLLLTHGEGYGLPTFEAVYTGLPTVTTGWSGQLDYLVDTDTGEDMFYNVAYDIQPIQDEAVWDGVLIKESMWAFPREASAKHQMRKAYNNLSGKQAKKEIKKFKDYAAKTQEKFSSDKMYSQMVESVCSALGISSEKPAGQEILSF